MSIFAKTLYDNFYNSINFLIRIVELYPDTLWNAHKKFYYLTYHTSVFLDYYLSNPVKEYQAHLPYKLTDPKDIPAEGIDDVLPGRNYSREDVINLLETAKQKLKLIMVDSPENKLEEKWITKEEADMHGLCPPFITEYSVLEILFYNLRHLQHHSAQLNMLLKQETGEVAEYLVLST